MPTFNIPSYSLLYSEDFSLDVLSDPGIHGILSGSGSNSAWQSTTLSLLLQTGSS